MTPLVILETLCGPSPSPAPQFTDPFVTYSCWEGLGGLWGRC